jgi:hypothetical protein
MSNPRTIPVAGGNQPPAQILWDQATGDKTVITDGGSRVDVYNGTLHSWGTYNQSGQWTGGGVGDTHPH